MLLFMVKPNITLSFVFLNIWESGKSIKSTKNSAVLDHMLVCNNIVSFEEFSVLANRSNDFRLKLQETFLIHRDRPQLNKISESAPFMLLP